MDMFYQSQWLWRILTSSALLCCFLLSLTACNNTTSGNTGLTLAGDQSLTFPDVGVSDLSTLDPARGTDQNSTVILHMLYSGLVRADQNGQILPDQATWQLSPDRTTYTFTLKPGITFSDGTPVTAQTYVATWTRALLPALSSPLARTLAQPISGAEALANGQAQTLSGITALTPSTLQVTLTQPTASFLTSLTNPLFFPLNTQFIAQYGQQNWSQHAVNHGLGTGPFMVKAWEHNLHLLLIPNPHYYGTRTRIRSVDVRFIADPLTAYYSYSAGLYDLIWGLSPANQLAIKGTPGFSSTTLWQTDALFFDTTTAPFDQLAVRQAFAQALNKQTLIHTALNDSATPATTLLPPGLPDYKQSASALPFNAAKARTLLHSAYPDLSDLPPLTFSYPISQVNQAEALAFQTQWQSNLGVQVTLRPLAPDTYRQEMDQHQIPFGFSSCALSYPDPSSCLNTLLSASPVNAGQWQNTTYDHLLMQAQASSPGDAQSLYAQAEQLALSDVVVFPIDHPIFSAVIPPWLHGVSLNGAGFFFGDWSEVSILAH